MSDDEPFVYAGDDGRPSNLPLTIIPPGSQRIPTTPRHLGPRGKEAWVRYWRTGRAWLVNDMHADLVLMIAEAVDDRAELRRALQQSDMVTAGSRKQPVLNPIVRQLDATDAKLADLLKRAGFLPTPTRRRVGVRRPSRLDQLRDRKDNR
jgi:hypothetical protein